MQNIPHCTDIRGDHSWLRFWTLKDFQPDFAVKQVETDHNRKTNYLFVLGKSQRVHCLHLTVTAFQQMNTMPMLLKMCIHVMWLIDSLC